MLHTSKNATYHIAIKLMAIAGIVATWLAPTAQAAREVVVYTSVDQVFAAPVFKSFEKTTGIRVRAVFDTEETKSTGVLNRLVAEGRRPQADVFWSGDPVRPFILIDKGLVQAYRSPATAAIPAQFKGADGTWTGFAARARVLLLNKRLLAAGPRPRSVRDLADARFRGKGTMANPLYGTTTMHVAALFDAWGDARAKAFLDRVKANGTRIASSNGEVRRLVVSGEAAFGLTDTDDAHEAVRAGALVDVVFPDQDREGTLVMPTTVVLIRNAPRTDAGKALIDYLLSAAVEKRLAVSGAHMPLRRDVPPPENGWAVSGVRAMKVDYRRLGATIELIGPTLRSWAGL